MVLQYVRDSLVLGLQVASFRRNNPSSFNVTGSYLVSLKGSSFYLNNYLVILIQVMLISTIEFKKEYLRIELSKIQIRKIGVRRFLLKRNINRGIIYKIL